MQGSYTATFMLSTVHHLRTPRALLRARQLYSTNVTTDELLYPEPRSMHHQDLPSFLIYASRTGLDTNSTVYVGNHYEYTVLSALEKLGMSLKRIGGASDYGTDLLGTWTLPPFAHPLKLLIQCKTSYGGPAQTRELEGAFAGAPQGWKGPGVLGFLVSQKPATKSHREALRRSRWPMGYIFCKADGKIMQMTWNRRAKEEGLEGVGVETKYSGGDITEREVLLTWKGNVLNQ